MYGTVLQQKFCSLLFGFSSITITGCGGTCLILHNNYITDIRMYPAAYI